MVLVMPTSNPVSKLFTFALTSADAIVSNHAPGTSKEAGHAPSAETEPSNLYPPFSLSVFLSPLLQSFSCCLFDNSSRMHCTGVGGCWVHCVGWGEAAGGDHALRGGNNQLLSTEASCCCCCCRGPSSYFTYQCSCKSHSNTLFLVSEAAGKLI